MAVRKYKYIESFMRNYKIVILITITLMIIGLIALRKMPRNEFPNFTIRTGVIVGVFPGATSTDIEAQLTNPVENYIFGFKEINKAKTTSQSRDGIMYLFVELNDDIKNSDEVWSKIKHGLNEFKMTLPAGVIALVANSDFGDTAAFLITLSSDTKDYRELEKELKKLEAGLRKIPTVSKIKHYGLRKEKIYVYVKPEKLNEYNIKSMSLLASYQLNGMVSYSGVMKDSLSNRPVHVSRNFESEKDLAETIVYADHDGNSVRLKDIATIERKYEEPDNYIKQQGRKTILLSLEMQTGNNIVAFGKDVDKVLSEFEKDCEEGIIVSKISELPRYVDHSINNFLREFLISIIAVILVTLLLLPFRVASVAGITIPIAVFITLTFSYMAGIELNTVTLATLILVLGMIVDNSIVVIDNYIEKLDHGISRWNAAIQSAGELFTPILTATLAIIAAYIPLMFFTKGIASEFIGPFPIVVAIALIVSVLVAIMLVPYLNFYFIRNGLKRSESETAGNSFLNKVQGWYDTTIEKAFRHKRIVLFAGAAVVVGGFMIFTTLDIQLFPQLERNQLAVEVFLPRGSSLESTARVVDSLERIMLKDERITNVTSFTGTASPRFHTLYAPNMPAPEFGQLLVNTVSNEATREIARDYSKNYGNTFVNAYVKYNILAMQATKNNIEIRITSDSLDKIRQVEEEVMKILRNTPYLAQIRDDWGEKEQNIMVVPDRDKANRLGYSNAMIAASVMTGLDGLPLTTIWEDDYGIPVVLKQDTKESHGVQSLQDQYITSPVAFTGNPLRSFATIKPQWTEGNIVHRNGTRTLTILVDNDMDVVAQSIFSGIKKQTDNLKLPEGVSISYGGDYETSMREFPPILVSLGISVIIIFFILMFQFGKQRIALLIMTTMILGIPGAFIGIKIMQYPASLTGMLGITSLCGMVVRNGIILIDYALVLMKKNKRITIAEAAISAAKRRMRPIFLTSMAASVGVIPMIASRSPLWGPLGTVICFGLIISMILTLYILPILFCKLMSGISKSYFTGKFHPKAAVATIIILLLPVFSMAQSLSLDECKTMASKNNHKLEQARNEVEISRQVKKSAFTNYFPKANAMVTAFKTNDYLLKKQIPSMNLPVYDGNPVNLQHPTLFTYFPGMELNLLDYMNSAAVTVTQPLFTGGRIIYGNRLAQTGVKVTNEKLELANREIEFRTEELYWLIVSLNGKKRTIDSYLELLNTLEHDVNAALRAGLVQRTDLLKVQLKHNELEVNRMKLNNGISMSMKALCQHIGLQYDSTLMLSDVPQINDDNSAFVSFKSNVTNRPEYQMLQYSIEAEKLKKRIEIGENLPTIAIGAAGLYYDVMDKSDKRGAVFANVSIPLSDWWSGSHKIKEHNLRIKSAEIELEDAAQLLDLQVNNAYNEMTEHLFKISVARKSVEQATENYKVTNDNYKAGITGMSDLLEARSALQSSEDNLTEATCNYLIKRARYISY